jgi:hypothetical protein
MAYRFPLISFCFLLTAEPRNDFSAGESCFQGVDDDQMLTQDG